MIIWSCLSPQLKRLFVQVWVKTPEKAILSQERHWLLCHIGGSKFGCFCRWNARGWWRHIMPCWCTTMYQKMAPYSGLARILVVLHNTLVAPGNLHDNSSPTGRTPPNWNIQFLKSFPANPAKRMLEQLRNWNRNLGGGRRSAVGGFNPHCNLDISRGRALAWLDWR